MNITLNEAIQPKDGDLLVKRQKRDKINSFSLPIQWMCVDETSGGTYNNNKIYATIQIAIDGKLQSIRIGFTLKFI